MTRISTVGLDIGKRVLQVHCSDVAGQPVLQRKLRREEVITFFRALPACHPPAPPIACCSHRAARRINCRGSNRQWMKVQGQVTPSSAGGIHLNPLSDFPGPAQTVTREGDRINAVLAATGYNFSLLLQWLAALLRALIAILNLTARKPRSA